MFKVRQDRPAVYEVHTSAPKTQNFKKLFTEFIISGEHEATILNSWIEYLNAGGDPSEKLYDGPHLFTAFECLVRYRCFNDELEKFLCLLNVLLQKGADPNIRLAEIKISRHILKNATPLHVLCYYWKNKEWSLAQEESFERLFDRLLEDPRLDLRTTYSEEYAYREEPDDAYYDGDFDTQTEDVFEEINIFHYAAYLGDSLIIKLLARDPELIHSRFQIVAGKNMLTGPKYTVRNRSLIVDPRFDYPLNLGTPGTVAFVESAMGDSDYFKVERLCKVTAIHIAAKKLNLSAVHFLIGRGAFLGAQDSSGSTPQAYIQPRFYYLNTKQITRERRELLKILKYTPQLPRQLPQAQLLLPKEGYSILLDNRTKVPVYAYEKLTKDKLAPVGEPRPKYFCQDDKVPKLNRAKTKDYTNTGYHRGHMRAAANASGEKKKATFIMSNVFPHNPSINNSYWKQLENHVRDLTEKYDSIEVFTGVLYVPESYRNGKRKVCYEVIGQGDVAVPTHSYKVLFMHKKKRTTEAAYLMPNRAVEDTKILQDFEVSVEMIQKLSGVVFSTMY